MLKKKKKKPRAFLWTMELIQLDPALWKECWADLETAVANSKALKMLGGTTELDQHSDS